MLTRRNLPRILIADDHMLVAEACKNLLESDYEVVRPHRLVSVGDSELASLTECSCSDPPWRHSIPCTDPVATGTVAFEELVLERACCTDACPQQKLNLLQLPAIAVTQLRTGSPQVMRSNVL
jgi:hypothetical protein